MIGQKTFRSLAPPSLLQELHYDAMLRVRQSNENPRVRPVVIRKEERTRIGFEQDITIQQVNPDSYGFAVLAKSSQKLLADVESRSGIGGALLHASQQRDCSCADTPPCCTARLFHARPLVEPSAVIAGRLVTSAEHRG
jgi:hypothetical protein